MSERKPGKWPFQTADKPYPNRQPAGRAESAAPDRATKKPRLFYWEDAEDCWAPAEDLLVDNIISVDLFLNDGDIEEIRFKRMDMTDDEFSNIPER